jgi:gluconate 2-dehydrogenase alpha chain
MGSGASGVRIADFDGDLFDHSGLPFLRGGILLALSLGFRPTANFGVLPQSVKPKWGSEWKKAALHYYDRTGEHRLPRRASSLQMQLHGPGPIYKDHFGDPLLRFTLDWRENERRMAEFATAKAVEIAREIGAKEVTPFPGLRSYDATRSQSTHIQGGTIMGSSPDCSVVNPYLQHWRVSNLLLGASAFPQNASANPTPTILALTYRTADAIVNPYLKNPAPLA